MVAEVFEAYPSTIRPGPTVRPDHCLCFHCLHGGGVFTAAAVAALRLMGVPGGQGRARAIGCAPSTVLSGLFVHIWVDADACPGPIKQILFRAAQRAHVPTTLVANQRLAVPASPYVNCLQVGRGFDVADQEIVARVAQSDLVVTADIALAAEVIAKGAHALSPRGERFLADTVGARLTMRDFTETLRASGIQTRGPAAPGPKERQAFANQLDRLLARRSTESTGDG